MALAAGYIPLAPDLVFTFSFLAIIPLSGLAQLALEDLSASLNVTLGRLLVAFSDNIIELIVSEEYADYSMPALITENKDWNCGTNPRQEKPRQT